MEQVIPAGIPQGGPEKLKWWIWGIVFVVVIILGVVGFMFLPDFGERDIGDLSNPLEGDDGGEAPKTMCSSDGYANAVLKTDVSLCEGVPNEVANPYYDNYCRNSCLKEVSNFKADKALCESIASFKDIEAVEGWEDPRKVGSLKDHCYSTTAFQLNDLSLCDNSETDFAKERCKSLVSMQIEASKGS